MPQAAIRWDGNAGPYSGLVVSTPVTVSNLNVGGEVSWEFALFSKPVGSAAVLADTVNDWEKTLTPDVPGTYHVRVVVNGSLLDASAAAVLHVALTETNALLRMPGTGETTEWDSDDGWAESMKQVYERVSHGFGARPSAAVTYRGRTWLTRGGVGVADTLDVCMKDALDVYVWKDVLAATSGGVEGHLAEDVTSQIDGLTDTFVIPDYESGTLMVSRNGVEENPTLITEIGTTMVQLPVVPLVGEYLVIWYTPL